MLTRQITRDQWMIVEPGNGVPWTDVRNLPRGSGILLLNRPSPKQQRRLRYFANVHALRLVLEAPGRATRVHNLRELTRARLQRTPLILLSPIYPTSTHPDCKPLSRMRAAALARLAERQVIALGGMNSKRHARVAGLGFVGWAGISAFKT